MISIRSYNNCDGLLKGVITQLLLSGNFVAGENNFYERKKRKRNAAMEERELKGF